MKLAIVVVLIIAAMVFADLILNQGRGLQATSIYVSQLTHTKVTP